MKKVILILLAFVPYALGCATAPVKSTSEVTPVEATAPAKAQKTINLALAFFDQGAYSRSALLFEQASELYNLLGDQDCERLALIAAAKMHLMASKRKKFLLCISKLEHLADPLEMPSEDEQLLFNLAAHMKHESELPYPVKVEWRKVFNR